MSLAMYAAPFDTDLNQINSNDNDTPIGRKKIINNRTQKRIPKENNYSEKVNSVLQSIHNLPENNHDSLGDFNPIPPPTSVGVEQTKLRETVEIDSETEETDINYKRFMPDYDNIYKKTPQNLPYYSNTSSSQQTYSSSNDVLLDKLNYMINLLEQQQDEKTNNVTEEVILYSFLGIFIIFIVDSFVRVGKYVR